MTAEFVLNIMPKTINGVMMWIISFLMFFLLIRKYEENKKSKKKKKFLNLDNSIVLFTFLLTLIAFIINVFIIGTQPEVSKIAHVLIPATVYSIILSVLAFATFLFTLFYYKFGKKKVYLKKFVSIILISLLFFGLKKLNYMISLPYGTLVFSIINLIMDFCIFGFLLPSIFSFLILYTLNFFNKK